MQKTDVLVAGAGPVGLYLAGLLEKSGRTVRVLEEHGNIGRPNHCSGLVSRNLDLFIRPRSEWIEHEVSGAVISSGQSSVTLRKGRTAAYVIDRGKFDAFLASGVSEIISGAKAESVSMKEDGISLKTSRGVFRADMLLGCDGANSVVARHFQSRPKQLLMGVIAITREENHSPNVEIMIDKKASPDGFFWKIPRGRTTEYGLFGSLDRSQQGRLQAGIADFLELEGFFRIRPAERRAGLIPIGPGKSYFPRTLLVGDAAGMSKPWSGGGIIYGLTAAKIAAKTISEAFEQNDFSEGFLARYEREWKRAFGRQIQAGMLWRKIFENMGDFEIQMALRGMRIFSPVLNGLDMDFLM